MQIEDYFDFLRPDDIRLKGTRIGIETILYDYVYGNESPETIVTEYPSLTLEQVYATLTYYLHNQEAVTSYLTDWIEHGDRMREEQGMNPTPVMLRLHRLVDERNILETSVK